MASLLTQFWLNLGHSPTRKKTQQKFTIWELVRKSKMTSQIHGWNYSQKVTFWAELKMKGGKTQGLDK